MRVIRELDEARIGELHQLYQKEWWTNARTLEEVRAVVRGSQLCYGLLNASDELVAFARVLTDYIFKALIFDVIVREDFRGQGLGDRLMELIQAEQKLKAVQHFELYCLPDMEPFYAHHGYSPEVSGVRLLRRRAR